MLSRTVRKGLVRDSTNACVPPMKTALSDDSMRSIRLLVDVAADADRVHRWEKCASCVVLLLDFLVICKEPLHRARRKENVRRHARGIESVDLAARQHRRSVCVSRRLHLDVRRR